MNRVGRALMLVSAGVALSVAVAACAPPDPILGPSSEDVGMVDRGELENPAAVGAEEVYANLGVVNPPLTADDQRLVGSEDMTYEEFVQAVGVDINGMWQALFEDSGYAYSNADILLYEQPVSTSGCLDVADPEMGPFYCPVNGLVHYPLTWRSPASGENPAETGDFAVAYIVAHEMGHHVENLLGEFQNPETYTIQLELRADCLAGVWARSTYEQGLLEPGDLGEATQIAADAADLPGTPPTDPGAHGTERQRTNAFFTGYETGDPNECQF